MRDSLVRSAEVGGGRSVRAAWPVLLTGWAGCRRNRSALGGPWCGVTGGYRVVRSTAWTQGERMCLSLGVPRVFSTAGRRRMLPCPETRNLRARMGHDGRGPISPSRAPQPVTQWAPSAINPRAGLERGCSGPRARGRASRRGPPHWERSVGSAEASASQAPLVLALPNLVWTGSPHGAAAGRADAEKGPDGLSFVGEGGKPLRAPRSGVSGVLRATRSTVGLSSGSSSGAFVTQGAPRQAGSVPR